MANKENSTETHTETRRKAKIMLAMPISIRPTLTDKGYVIVDADGVEHFFYNKPRSKKLIYDGFCAPVKRKK